MLDREYIFLDLETTGLDAVQDEIIEIGAVKSRQGEIIDTFHTLVKPGCRISYKIKKLTGISDEMLNDAAPVKQILPQLLDFIGDLPLVGHNINFDLGFINQALGTPVANEFIDTLELARLVLPTAASYRLGSLRERLTGLRPVQHRALEDAKSTAEIFYKILESMAAIDISVLRDINRLLAVSQWSGKNVFLRLEQHKSAFFPLAKIDLAYNFMKKNEEIKLAGPALNNEPDSSRLLIDPAKLHGLLAADGPFARRYPDYQYRSQQVDIITLTAKAFNEEKHLLIEAGTGTGKSLAYLLPAIYWAVQNNTRVVIATHTINLQEQLWQNDLPVIKQITGLEFKEALVKGRNNYICLRKWEQNKKDAEALNATEKLFCARLQVWLTNTMDGDRSEINLNAQEAAGWTDFCADPETCLGPKCSWFNSHCFFMKSRHRAEDAHILITNHSVLLSDLKTDNRILPAHDYLVIDEAHNLEDQAGEQLGAVVTSSYINRLLQHLYSGGLGSQNPGLLYNIKSLFEARSNFVDDKDLKERAEKAIAAVKETRAGFRDFSACLLNFCQANSQGVDDYAWQTVRIREEQHSGQSWAVLESCLENLTSRLKTTAVNLEQLHQLLAGDLAGDGVEANGLLKELDYQIKVILQAAEDIRAILYAADPEIVAWVEYDKTGQFTLKAVPVSVGAILAEKLFMVKKGVILASATLSIDGNFDHFRERLGLNCIPAETVLEIQVTSPFNYDEQAFLGVIRDLPDPGKVPEEIFAGEAIPVLADIVKVLQGRTLVLFTSHRLLRQVYAGLCTELEKEDITVLGHNIDGGRSRLLEEFRANARAVLLGASSFWEGVDLPGDILKCVVIAKLPFAPPNQPLMEARMEKLAAMNKVGFTNLLLPQAVIRMKQGFGRLIRSEKDEGVVVVLDRRIAEKRYGRKFFNSLPICTHFKGDKHLVLHKLTDWLDGKRPALHQFKLIANVSCVAKQLKEKNEPLL